ncbi:coiled-coil domain-containing protein 82 [Hoplias malabaricus]|uniref:coiled-coil domain-containing protein 82 n=1 Tax=Hoplias malabaricus TaxID=27720 RepID=UPI0034627703
MFKSVGKLFGMRRKAAPPKSRIDRKKTRVNPLDQMLDDSDEGSYRSTTSPSSDSEYRESADEDSYGTDSSYRPKRERKRSVGEEEEEEESGSSGGSSSSRSSSSSSSSEAEGKSSVPRGRRRKRASSALNDDSSDSDSDIGTEPRRKAQQKKRQKLPDSEEEAQKEKKREAELKEAAAKRKERKNKLLELARRRKTVTPRRRRRTTGSEEEEDKEDKEDKTENKEKEDSEDSSSEEDANPPMNSSEEEKHADNDSLKDFVVDEEEEEDGDKKEVGEEPKDKDFLSQLPRQFITGSQQTHFKVVVKALLINAMDTSFLKSLYDGERTKRYAQEMKSSLHHFDERLVLPRLENLKQRSRWKDRYKERVECYPKVRIAMVNVHTKGCEACELHRHGRFSVRLSGQLYHCNTLQEDQFMPNDSQMFFVGSVCASRTKVYHALKHFKYHLYERCRTALEAQKEVEVQNNGNEDDEPVKDTVNKVFMKLQEAGWITEQYDEFQEHLNAADFFQEEKLD